MRRTNLWWAALALTVITACSDEGEPADTGTLAGGDAGNTVVPNPVLPGADGGTTLTPLPDGGVAPFDAGQQQLPVDGSVPVPGRDGSVAATDGGGGGPVVTPMGKTCLKGSGTFAANGPYKVKKKDVTIGSQGAYTIFYPDPLETGCLHPIVAWGNGTLVTGSGTYAFYQEHAASYGIVVIASHNDNVGSGQFHTAGLDYLLAQNKEQGSEFFGKLSTKAGVSGHSQGGAGANAAATHPNVEAVGNVQGAFGTAPRGAAFLCLTGTADIAPDGCKKAVNDATSPALLANWQGGDHISTATLLGFTLGDAGTKQYQRLYTAWFRCFLADDGEACNMFKGGAACPVCKDMGWAEIFTKNIP
jgi:hypothetical protein